MGNQRVAALVADRSEVRWHREHQPISIRQLMEWAFSTECVRLNLDADHGFGGGVGPEYRIMQRAMLTDPITDKPVRIDGGGRTPKPADAEIVAAVVARLPLVHGGRAMAVKVAELARTCQVPDTMCGVTPKIVPREWAYNQHGWRGKTESLGTELIRIRGKVRAIDRRWCPIVFEPSPHKLAGLRRGYLQWWGALRWLRSELSLVEFDRWELTDRMPPMTPWRDEPVDRKTEGG
ncbi:MAG: hypothetical protein AAGG09_06530 [Pseudomonadota bacterium]